MFGSYQDAIAILKKFRAQKCRMAHGCAEGPMRDQTQEQWKLEAAGYRGEIRALDSAIDVLQQAWDAQEREFSGGKQ